MLSNIFELTTRPHECEEERREAEERRVAAERTERVSAISAHIYKTLIKNK